MLNCLILNEEIKEFMKSENNTDQKNAPDKVKVAKVLITITILALFTFLIMNLISPHARALPKFLAGFAFIFVIIVLVALYFNYIAKLYKDIRNKSGRG